MKLVRFIIILILFSLISCRTASGTLLSDEVDLETQRHSQDTSSEEQGEEEDAGPVPIWASSRCGDRPHCIYPWIAPKGQKRMHFPQLVHLLSSTIGALKPFCLSAFAGQILTDGHGWFCGHRDCETEIGISPPIENITYI